MWVVDLLPSKGQRRRVGLLIERLLGIKPARPPLWEESPARPPRLDPAPARREISHPDRRFLSQTAPVIVSG